LAAALDIPLRQQNALLLSAGSAPYWDGQALAANENAQINSALDFMLTQQEPFPAFVVDWQWNPIRLNRGAALLIRYVEQHVPMR
jgi:hypothetical protein